MQGASISLKQLIAERETVEPEEDSISQIRAQLIYEEAVCNLEQSVQHLKEVTREYQRFFIVKKLIRLRAYLQCKKELNILQCDLISLGILKEHIVESLVKTDFQSSGLAEDKKHLIPDCP